MEYVGKLVGTHKVLVRRPKKKGRKDRRKDIGDEKTRKKT